MRLFASAIVLFACLEAAFAEKPPYSRYQSVVDRQMFGPLPPGFDPAKLPSEVSKSSSAQRQELTKEQAKLKSAIRFSVINVTPDGKVAVGFTDSSDAKSPRHYYLKVGESRGGWLVKEADPETATMTIAKDEIEVTLTIGGDSAKDDAATAKAGAATKVAQAPRSSLLATQSLSSRRKARVAAERKQLEDGNRKLDEDRQKFEEERAAEREERDRQEQEQRQALESLRAEIQAARAAEAARRKEAEKAETAETAETAESGGETSDHENDDAE